MQHSVGLQEMTAIELRLSHILGSWIQYGNSLMKEHILYIQKLIYLHIYRGVL